MANSHYVNWVKWPTALQLSWWYTCFGNSNIPSKFRISESDKCNHLLDLAPIKVRTFVKVNGDEFDLVKTSFPLYFRFTENKRIIFFYWKNLHINRISILKKWLIIYLVYLAPSPWTCLLLVGKLGVERSKMTSSVETAAVRRRALEWHQSVDSSGAIPQSTDRMGWRVNELNKDIGTNI